MKYLVPLCSAAAAVLLAAGGASAQTQPSDTSATPTAAAASPADPVAAVSRVRARRDVITTEEIDATHVTTAFEVVQRLRPQWLHNRGGPYPDPDGSVEVRVFFNGQPVGNVESLKQYAIMEVGSMRWVDPIRARGTYGPGNGRGVITVTGR
ncbi:MAG TPA: hypothetical protein VF541_10445 [Longimicrobium sp.]|jgi:hypothetical protein